MAVLIARVWIAWVYRDREEERAIKDVVFCGNFIVILEVLIIENRNIARFIT